MKKQKNVQKKRKNINGNAIIRPMAILKMDSNIKNTKVKIKSKKLKPKLKRKDSKKRKNEKKGDGKK